MVLLAETVDGLEKAFLNLSGSRVVALLASEGDGLRAELTSSLLLPCALSLAGVDVCGASGSLMAVLGTVF